MKKIISVILIILVCLCFAACEETDHSNDCHPPASSSNLEGKNNTDVIKQFEESGFSNITTEKIDDLITGWLTKDGDIEEISIDGDTSFSTDTWYPKGAKVVIKYHTFPDKESKDDNETDSSSTVPTTESQAVQETILTVENCSELSNILQNKSEIDKSYSDFATKYKDQTIEFDGRIDYCSKHDNYKTRFDYLVSAGDYNPDHQIGPTFKFEDVNYYDLHTDIDTVSVGLNVRISAKVVSFNENTGIFYLKPISIKSR